MATNRVDVDDLQLLMQRLRRPADPHDPADLDYDGLITVPDARILVTLCTKALCVR